jgi:hypothetical protein
MMAAKGEALLAMLSASDCSAGADNCAIGDRARCVDHSPQSLYSRSTEHHNGAMLRRCRKKCAVSPVFRRGSSTALCQFGSRVGRL